MVGWRCDDNGAWDWSCCRQRPGGLCCASNSSTCCLASRRGEPFGVPVSSQLNFGSHSLVIPSGSRRWGYEPRFIRDTVTTAANLTVGTRSFKVIISPQCSGYKLWLIFAFLRRLSVDLAKKISISAGAITILPCRRRCRVDPEYCSHHSAGHYRHFWMASHCCRRISFSSGLDRFQRRGFGHGHNHTADAFFHVASRITPVAADPDLTTAYLFPFLAIITAAMITGAVSAGFDWLSVRVLVAGAALWKFRKSYSDLKWSWSWEAIAIGELDFCRRMVGVNSGRLQ